MPNPNAQPNSTFLKDSQTEELNKTQEKISIIQKSVRQNKVVFYGYPLLVLLYSFAIIIFLIYPVVNKYFDVRKGLDTLDKNYENLKKTVININAALARDEEFRYYESRLTGFIPEESRLGSIINKIQQKADDFSLEREIGVPSTNNDKNNIDSLNSIAEDVNTDDLFQTINSGEVRFRPKSLRNKESEAKLLSIDLTIRGKKNNFLAFVKELESMQPLLNVTSVTYQESKNDSGDPDVSVDLRIESYALKLNFATTNLEVNKFMPNDPAILSFIPEETFDLDENIVNEFSR